MPIALKDAKASTNSLTGSGAFDTIKKNLTAHADYHFSEQIARA